MPEMRRASPAAVPGPVPAQRSVAGAAGAVRPSRTARYRGGRGPRPFRRLDPSAEPVVRVVDGAHRAGGRHDLDPAHDLCHADPVPEPGDVRATSAHPRSHLERQGRDRARDRTCQGSVTSHGRHRRLGAQRARRPTRRIRPDRRSAAPRRGHVVPRRVLPGRRRDHEPAPYPVAATSDSWSAPWGP